VILSPRRGTIPGMTAAAARSEAAEVYETRARAIKAAHLADLLIQRGCLDSDTVRHLSEGQRRGLEQAAGVREASALAWETVAVLVEHAAHSAGGPVPLDL